MDRMDSLITLCREWHTAGWPISAMSATLRAYECPKALVILVISEATNQDFNSVKQLVHEDSTWADVRAGDEAFHDVLIKAIEQARG